MLDFYKLAQNKHHFSPKIYGALNFMFSQKMRSVFIFIFIVCSIGDLTADPTWMQLTPATSPSTRSKAAMAYDQATGQMIPGIGMELRGHN